MTEPLVSICTLAYNHKKYISEAIDSFLMQQTNFLFEILIHDDASKDGTEEIIRYYEVKYSEIIKPLYERENQWRKGLRGSAIINFPRAQGKYIALCEGDDYWTDPYKLQKQVDFLEANPAYGMISSDIYLIDKNGTPIADNNMLLKQRERRKPDIDFFDLLEINLINTLTVCVRTDLMKKLASRIEKENLWFTFDYWYWLNIALESKIKIIYDKTATYRVHEGGISREIGYLGKRLPFVYFDVINTYLKQKNNQNISIKNQHILMQKLFYIIKNKNSTNKMRIWALKNMVKSPYFIPFLYRKINNRYFSI